uniref:Putative histone transcription regulator hira wd repeat superfamily protein n=1 Tax=Xenopsylla cheopis TaxID=163159 RepID=A0A6M2DIZ6_XENCH
MKCTIPEISWHNRDPVLSIDLQPKVVDTDVQRLATGGTDSHVLIWYIKASDDGLATVEIAADLTRHEKAVNVVRWCPSGEYLASGDDDNVIMIWKQRTDADPPSLEEDNEADKEVWNSIKILRGHLQDVYDISWSPNSLFLISGSVDNTAILWDLTKGKSIGILDDQKNFVQGVTWDPQNKYVATMSSDRTCRVYDIKTKKVVSRSSKGKPEGENNQCPRIYHDDTLQSFFRRLSFSPDGLLLAVPSGAIEKQNRMTINTTFIYSRYSLKIPIVALPSKEYSIAVKFCPLLFCLRNTSPVIPLPYRMIIAVATRSSVVLYDTEQSTPFAVISNIHYTRLTDISWSSDGKILAVSSTDGFCSLITFANDELGKIYEKLLVDVDTNVKNDSEEIKSIEQLNMHDESAINGMDVSDNLNTTDHSHDEIRLVIEDSQISGDNIDSSKQSQNENVMDIDEKLDLQLDVKQNESKESDVTKDEKPVIGKTPRRVPLITLSSPKSTKIKSKE